VLTVQVKSVFLPRFVALLVTKVQQMKEPRFRQMKLTLAQASYIHIMQKLQKVTTDLMTGKSSRIG